MTGKPDELDHILGLCPWDKHHCTYRITDKPEDIKPKIQALITAARVDAFEAGWAARMVGINVKNLEKSKNNYLEALKGNNL